MSTDHGDGGGLGADTLRRRDIVQQEADREDRKSVETRVEAAIDECAVQIGRAVGGTAAPFEESPYAVVARLCRKELLPELAENPSTLADLDLELADDPDWYWDSITRFQARPIEFEKRAGAGDPAAQEVVEQAFYSLETAAAEEGPIEARYQTEAEAQGFAIKMGIHKQKPWMDFGDPVKAITRELGALKHYFTGGTSGGKSSGASRQTEDYYRASVGRGRDFKIFDPVGLNTENVNAYDIPMQDDDLRRVREEHDRPPSWAEAAEFIEERWGVEVEPGDEYDPDSGVPREVWEMVDYEPEAEILVPLTPDLKTYEIPYDLEEEEFVPTPFTIPASDISEELLSAVIAARVSSGEARTIRQAYRQVDRQYDDWSLDDLARTIQTRDDLSEKDQESAVRIIRNLESEGYIRTASDEHALDDAAWSRIFHSTDVATVINQTPVESQLSRYLIIAYLIEQVWDRRFRAHRQPNLVMWLRELHKIAPHGMNRRKQGDAVQNVMEHIIGKLNDIQRMPRDINTHIIADTQDPTDPEKSVRERFNRYVVFGGSSSDIDDIFDWSNQDGALAFKGTIGDKSGHAGIIKGCEPAVTSSNRWGISPVHLTPPSWHHHDKDEGPSGWQKRTEIARDLDILNDEELRTPEDAWELEPPAEKRSTRGFSDGDEDGEDAEDDVDEEPADPRDQYSRKEIIKMQARQLRATTTLSYEKIAEKIPDNPKTGDSYDRSTVRGWAKHIDQNSGELDLELDFDMGTDDA